ncbi:MAG: hypothetical protein R2769_04825 [Saprospiraceae bacterium]
MIEIRTIEALGFGGGKIQIQNVKAESGFMHFDLKSDDFEYHGLKFPLRESTMSSMQVLLSPVPVNWE